MCLPIRHMTVHGRDSETVTLKNQLLRVWLNSSSYPTWFYLPAATSLIIMKVLTIIVYTMESVMASLGPCYPLRRWKSRSRRTSSPWYSREQGLLIPVLFMITYWIFSSWGSVNGYYLKAMNWLVRISGYIYSQCNINRSSFTVNLCTLNNFKSRLTPLQVSSSKEGSDSDFQKHIVDVDIHITITLSFSHLHVRLRCSSRRHSILGKAFLLLWIYWIYLPYGLLLDTWRVTSFRR